MRPPSVLTPGAAARDRHRVTAAELERIRDPQLRATIAACGGELPRLGGGAPFWVMQLPGIVYSYPVSGSSTVVRAPNVEPTEPSANLLLLDAPTIMTEWVLAAINIVVSVSLHTAAAEFPTPSGITTVTAQLLVGGDVVWQGGAEGEAHKEASVKFAGAGPFRISGDFNNPIPLPRGRSLQLRIGTRSTIETDQIITTVLGNNGVTGNGFISGTAVGSVSSIAYAVRQLTGHRTL